MCTLWRLWRREPPTVRRAATADAGESDRVVAELLLARVDAFHALAGTSADVIDAKATGLLTADIAAGTILVAAHGNVGRAWIVPALGLAVAAATFLRVIRTRTWDYGPDLEAFRRESNGAAAVDAILKMTSDMQASWALNETTVRDKGTLFHHGYRVLYASLVGALLLAVVHSLSS